MIKAAKILGINNSNFRGKTLILSPFREIEKDNIKECNLSNCVITQLDGEDLSNMDLHGSIISANSNTKFNGANLKGSIFVGNLKKCSFKGTNLKHTTFMKMEDTTDSFHECDFRYSTKLNIREYTHEDSILLNPYKGIFWKLIPDEELVSKYSLLDIHPKVIINKNRIIQNNLMDPTFGPLAKLLEPLAGADEETRGNSVNIDYLQDGSSQLNSIRLSDSDLSRLALLVVITSGYDNIKTSEQGDLLLTYYSILDDEYARIIFEDERKIKSILDYSYDEDPYGGARWNFSLAAEKYMSVEGGRQAHNWGFYSAIVESGPYTAIKR